jgi:hypothetical protein
VQRPWERLLADEPLVGTRVFGTPYNGYGRPVIGSTAGTWAWLVWHAVPGRGF